MKPLTKYVIILDGEWVYKFRTLIPLRKHQQENVLRWYADKNDLNKDKLEISIVKGREK